MSETPTTETPTTDPGLRGAESNGADPEGGIRAAISREMVRLYKEQFGRGPTKARTEFAGPDIVICTLENTFTPAERKLAEMGEHQRLRDTRLYFQHATEGGFITAVEAVLDRRVRAFNSSVDTQHDVSVEVFHLEPGPAAQAQGNPPAS